MHRNRKNIRLKGYDYSSKGLYFITICTKDREHYFGKIDHQKFEYSPIGAIAYTYWNEIPNHFRNARLGEFKIMPNHIHGIIEIVRPRHGVAPQSPSESGVRTGHGLSPQAAPQEPQQDSSESQILQSIFPNISLVEKEKIAENGEFNLLGSRYYSKSEIVSIFDKVKLEEVLDYEQPTNYIVESEDYDESFKTPVLTAGKSFILGYTNEEDGIYNHPLPVIIFDDFTTASKLVDFPFKIKSSAMKILKAKKSRANITFLYYLIQHINFDSSVHKRYWISQFSKIQIPLPPLSVQEEIVAEIKSYQKIMDGARQVVENYKPKIDIDPEWEMVELGEEINFVNGLTLSIPQCEGPNGIPIISMKEVKEDGTLDLSNIRTINIPKKNYELLKKGDLLFNWRNGSKHLVGKTAYFDLEGKYVFASFCLGIRVKERLDSKFLWLLLNQYRIEGKYMAFMRQNVNGLFNREELKILIVPIPPLETQRQIVAQIEKEHELVNASKQLIDIFEQKIKDRIARVWGEEKTDEKPALNIAAEPAQTYSKKQQNQKK